MHENDREQGAGLPWFHFFAALLPIYFRVALSTRRFQKVADSFPDCFTAPLADSPSRPVVEHKELLHAGEIWTLDLLGFHSVVLGPSGPSLCPFVHTLGHEGLLWRRTGCEDPNQEKNSLPRPPPEPLAPRPHRAGHHDRRLLKPDCLHAGGDRTGTGGAGKRGGRRGGKTSRQPRPFGP